MLKSAHHPGGVALSVLMAIMASYVALDLAQRVRTPDARRAVWWIAGGAFVLGTGIWSMHFVGMLSLSLPIAIGFAPGRTLASWLSAVAVAGLALRLSASRRIAAAQWLAGGLLMGAGISTMHYLGMAALVVEPGIAWDMPLVAASVAIACTASLVALYMFDRLTALPAGDRRAAQVVAAVIMGLAIAGMHYTGMAAASFDSRTICTSVDGLRGDVLEVLIVLATVSLFGMSLLSSAQDARLEEAREDSRAEREGHETARAASAAKTNFLARMSHELRTPLNAIHGFSELMHLEWGAARDDLQRHRLELVMQSSRHLTNLIEDLLDVSRIELGAIAVDVEEVDARTVIDDVVVEQAARARERGIMVQVGRSTPAWVLADPVRLRQILTNLLSNAIKYNRHDGFVRIDVEGGEPWSDISVSDSGPGLSEQQIRSLFRPFERLGQPTRVEGVGIGLVISQHLAACMGGELLVHSQVGSGSRFTVRLATAGAPVRTPAEPQPTAVPSRATVRGRVLYVEDDAVNQILVQNYVAQRPGIELVCADTGHAALALAAAGRFDLVLVDMSLPDTHGVELGPRLREVMGPACPPLVAYSASAMAADIAAAMACGFAEYLTKPTTVARLLETLDRHLRPHDGPERAIASQAATA